MEIWIIALLGIALSFFVKYAKRNNKEKDWSLSFWAKDNYPELIASLIGMVILVMIFREIEFDSSIVTEKFSWIKALPMDLVAGALAGYLNNSFWYALIRLLKRK